MPEKKSFSAVICELDPLHLGHLALLDAARHSSAGVVCVLSGNFVQRGGPAILDKWARARLALQAGADLVVGLPLPWACAGAERFAQGGVALAGALPGVGSLVFGSEAPDGKGLMDVAKALLTPGFSAALRQQPRDGAPFARRRQQAVASLLGPEAAAVLEKPNAALGVEYCKAILAQGLDLEPIAFPRRGAGHDRAAAPGECLSASQLRAMLLAGEGVAGLVPPFTLAAIQEETAAGRCPAALAPVERAVLARLRAMPRSEFASLPDISEGLENRLYKASRQAASLEELYALAKTKRYTHARLRRLVMAAFLGVAGGTPPMPPYLHVLAMTDTGASLLKGCALPVLARPADASRLPSEAKALWALEARADDLYALCCPVPQPCGRSLRQGVGRLAPQGQGQGRGGSESRLPARSVRGSER